MEKEVRKELGGRRWKEMRMEVGIGVKYLQSTTRDIPPKKHEYAVHGKLFPHNVWTDCMDHIWAGTESVGDCMVHTMYSRPSLKHPDSFPLILNMQAHFL